PGELGDVLGYELRYGRRASFELAEAALDHFLFALPHGDGFGQRIEVARQILDGGEDAFILQALIRGWTERMPQVVHTILQEREDRIGAQRQSVLEIADKKCAVGVRQHELSILQHLAMLLTENR